MNDNFLLPVYLCKEQRNGVDGVACYSDADLTETKAFIPWWNSSCPTKRNKYVTLNCYRWLVIWS